MTQRKKDAIAPAAPNPTSTDLAPPALLGDLRTLIEEARRTAAAAVNACLTHMYWRIGQRIRAESLGEGRAEYGARIVSKLSRQLTAEYGRSFSEKNLRHMIRFAEVFGDERNVSTLSRHLAWSHFLELIYLKDPLARDFYAEMSRTESWSVRTLRERVGSMLFERTALSRQPEAVIRREIDTLRSQSKAEPSLVLKDPYVLDFLGLQDRYLEKGEFRADFKGQMELYLRWLARHEQEPGDEPPLGIILCAGKKQEQIELLELDKAGIHVAQYLTVLPPREVFERKIHEAMQAARLRLENQSDDPIQ